MTISGGVLTKKTKSVRHNASTASTRSDEIDTADQQHCGAPEEFKMDSSKLTMGLRFKQGAQKKVIIQGRSFNWTIVIVVRCFRVFL